MSAFETYPAPGAEAVTILKVRERVNLSNSSELEAAARKAHDEGMRNLILDLSETPSISSAGLRSIVIIYRMLAGDAAPQSLPAAGGSNRSHISPAFKILNPTPDVRRILEIAGMSTRIEIYDDLDLAVASFSNPGSQISPQR